MKTKWKRLCGVIAVVVLLTFAGGCGLTGSKDKQAPESNNGAPNGESQDVKNPPVNPQPTAEEVELTLYFGDDQAMYLKPEKRTVKKAGKPVAELLVQELIKGPVSKDLNQTIPKGTKLISLEVVDGTAFVNFSKEIQTNHPGGSAGERMTAQSIVQTLAQLPEIDEVQFLLEGQKEESIWGHGYTAEPIKPEDSILE